MSSLRAVGTSSLFFAAFLSFASSKGLAAQTLTAFDRAAQFGAPVTVTGVLAAIYEDDFSAQRAELVYVIRDERTGRSFQLQYPADPTLVRRSGERVTVSGHAVDSEIYVSATTTTGPETATSTTSSNVQTLNQSSVLPAGNQSTLLMLANFADQNVSCSVDAMNNAMFADPAGLSVDALYRDSSHGRVSFSGAVVGPYTLNALSTDPCNLNGWAMATDAQAVASGVDLSLYSHKVYVMPRSTCSGAGYGSVGGAPSHAWVFACDTRGVLNHEIGHNLGMDHAGTLYPGSAFSEYADWTDPMATGTWQMRGLNAPHREQLGWVDSSSTQLITQSGTYTVAPLAIDPATAVGPQILTIRKPDTNEYYYLSYRTKQGFDQQISGWYQGRVSIHRYKGDGSSSFTYLLAGLADGESFVDEINGISVTLVAHNDTYATARLSFTCVAAVPSMSVTPSVQSAAAGQGLSYSVSVTNGDLPSCPASTFALNGVIPAGWTGNLSTSSLTLGPGQTGQATALITSPANAPVGSYSATIKASDVASSGRASSAGVTYTVLDTVSPSAPLKLTATAATKTKQIQLSWQASIDNVGVAGYRIWRNGVVVGSSTTTYWSDATYASGTTYTYTVAAYDAAGNFSAISNGATIALSGGGGRNK